MSNGGLTIKDIAERAGVSPATVSNVLNNRWDRVSPETARTVMNVARTLGYPTRAPSRNHGGTYSETIGLIVSSIVSPLYSQAVSGALAVADRFGFQILLNTTDGNEEDEARLVQQLVDRHVDGIIFVSPSWHHRFDAIDAVVKAEIPFVVVNREITSDTGLNILVENKRGTYEATQHLIELGHRDIGYIHLPTTGPRATTAAVERLAGFKEALRDYDLPDSKWMRTGVIGDQNGTMVGYSVMKELLCEDEVPTAVICGSDYLAIGAMRAAAELGLKVPADLAVVGHDDTPAAAYVTPPLTSIRQPMEAAGAEAMEALIQHLWRSTPLHGTQRLPCQLVVRSSSSPHVYV